ncbi:MAG: porin [Verrucomicrobiales bacterium]|nr:porin [Verrucomicrobiales bacterium]
MIKQNLPKCFVATLGSALLFVGSAIAGDKCLIIDDKNPAKCCLENPTWCDIFDKSTLYKNEENCLIQKVQLVGRYHGQYHSSSLEHSSGQSLGANYWEHRRFRVGTKIQFLNDFTFFNNWNIGDNNDSGARLTGGDFFGSVYEMYIGWKPSGTDNDLWVKVGKQKQKITREWSTSSKQLLTFERSHITNEVAATIAWGAEAGFTAFNIDHAFGIWLGGYDMDGLDQRGENFPGFDSRAGASYRASYGLTDATDIFFDYLYTNNSDGTQRPRGNDDADALSDYNHVLAFGTESTWDLGHCGRQFGLVTDVIYGIDREASTGNNNFGGNNNRLAGDDTFGLVFLPHVDLTERLQLVGKYAYASDSRLHRPQRAVATTNATARPNLEDVHTLYIGLNYRICGDNLKLMAGYEYLTADLYQGAGAGDLGSLSGDTWMLGLRTYF